MKTKRIATLVMLLGGIAAAAIVPRLDADQGIISKGGETSTFRATDADARAIERAHAEKAARIEARREEGTAAFLPDAIADTPALLKVGVENMSTIDVGLVTEASSITVQVTPTDGEPTKLPAISTIEIGPAELSATESEKAELVLRQRR